MQLAYNNSDILIDFKLRCITEAKMIDDNENSDDGLRLTRIVFNRKLSIKSQSQFTSFYFLEYNYNMSGPDDNGHLARQSNDIVIAFVKHMDKKTVYGKAYTYKIHAGKTGTLINPDGALGKRVIPHEVGHVLGASHGK